MAAVDVQEAHPGYKPVPTPISPDSSYMSQTGWNTLLALVDGAMPAIKPSSRAKSPHESLIVSDEEFEEILDDAEKRLPDGPSRELLAEYIEARPIDNPLFCQDCKNTLSAAPQRFQMAKIMNLMSKSPGSLLLTGYWNPPAQQPVHVREAIVKSWQTSRLVPLRMIAKTLGVMAQKANTTSSPWLGKLTKYTDLPRGWQPQEGYPFKFVQLETGSTTPHELQTDVVIVGSGCGGSVAAKNLSEAGHKVMVVEKSYYYPPESLPMSQNSAIQYLYDNNGMFLSNTSSTNILTGSTWGGGGTINWSVSLKLQDFVREEWAAAGLPLFTSPEYDECIDRVWSAIGAGEEGIRHNHGNNVVLNGAKKLGWRSKPVAQNTADKEHYCGQCHLGCGMNEKRGPTVAWLPDAAEAGAEFMEGLDVEKILFDADGTTAIGVQGVWTARGADGHVVTDEKAKKQRKVIIKANKVIVSTGSIQTPTLLARSGVKNPQVGQHLHLHPCNMLSAVFDDDKRGWEGGIITSYCGEFENLDNKGHGAKIETLCMVPYTSMTMNSWQGGLDCKMLLPKYRHMHSFIAIVRDRDTGRVYPDPRTGKPRIDYDASPFDAEHALDGLEAITKLCYVMGASEIRPQLPGIPSFIVDRDGDPELQARHKDGTDPEFTDPKFAAWLKKIRKIGNKPPVGAWTSAHQMGSCRMSSKPSTGVVDPKGKVWGHDNLYIADASVFPSASGVNPMVTVMSIADYISRQLVKEMAH